VFDHNPGVRKAREYHARAEAAMDAGEQRWFYHLRMAAGTVALASVLLLGALYVYAPIRASASGIERPPSTSRRFGWLEAFPGWPDYSLAWWIPAAVALASIAVVVATTRAPERVRRSMWVTLVTALLVTAAFLGFITGGLYIGSSVWARWQVVFALVPLVLAGATYVVHVVDERRGRGTLEA